MRNILGNRILIPEGVLLGLLTLVAATGRAWSDNWVGAAGQITTDQANTKVGIGKTPSVALDVNGATAISSTLGVTGVLNAQSRLNIGGATDNSTFALNVAGGVIATQGSRSIISYGLGIPGDPNFERMSIIHTGSSSELRSEWGGTGSARPLRLVVGGTTRYDISGAGTHTVTGPVSMSSTLDVTGNIFASGTGSGYWVGTPGTFHYGIFKSGASLAFRSGSSSDFMTVNSSGQPTFSTAVSMSTRLNIGGATDNSTFALNVAGGAIATQGTRSIISYGYGVPGDPNFERMSMIHTGSYSELRSEAGGTGTARPLRLVVGGTNRYDITNSGAHTITGPVSMSSTLNVGGAVDFSSGLSLAGNLTIGNGTGTVAVIANGAAETNRVLSFQTAGAPRWAWIVDNTAESGSDAGSKIHLRAFTDMGATIDSPIDIIRAAAGTITLSRPVSMSSSLKVMGNVHASGSGSGFWMDAPGTFHYGLFKSGSSLAFRSGSSSDFLTVNSSGQPTFSTPVTMASDLKVNGELTVATVKATNWKIADAPDYVFEKGYELASLEKVESFVKMNKHLPEIPSAREMKQKGLDLVKMNFDLLKKVEELTLHAIRQEKEMKRQAEEIRQLKERL